MTVALDDADLVGQMADSYLVLSIGGVQEFIAASRRTADLWTASRIVSRLCQAALSGIAAAGGEAVLPGSVASSAGLPNRVFAVIPGGDAAELAESAAVAVRQEWARLAGLTFRSPSGQVSAALATFPSLRWVVWHRAGDSPGSAPGTVPGYDEGWRVCQLAAAARGRVRDFPAYAGRGRQPCSLCGKREGEIAGSGVLPGRLRVAAGERVCPVCAVKRDPAVTEDLAGERAPFPSTASVATAPFRLAVISALAAASDSPDRRTRLAEAVRSHGSAVALVTAALRAAGAQSAAGLPRAGALPALDRAAQLAGQPVSDWVRLDGAWCLPESWQPESLLHENGLPLTVADQQRRALEAACAQGRAACSGLADSLRDAVAQRGAAGAAGAAPRPATYLAVVLQDADDMGRSLGPASMPDGRHDARNWHGEVSRALIRVAGAQAAALEEAGGRAVYAGGDDLLGLVPAAAAFLVARGCRELFLARTEGLLSRRSASTAVVLFHVSFPLQDALARARRALAEAKARPGKGGLAVVVLRRGGEKAAAVLPWRGRQGSDPAGSLEALAVGFRAGLSPGLINDMYRGRRGIAELARAGLDYGAEVGRLVGRHTDADAGPANAVSLVRAVEPATDRLSADDVRAWVDALDIARFVAQEAR
jgi:CRISPR-associated protein